MNRIAEVREITRSAAICARSAISASVIPSAKNSWAGVARAILEWQNHQRLNAPPGAGGSGGGPANVEARVGNPRPSSEDSPRSARNKAPASENRRAAAPFSRQRATTASSSAESPGRNNPQERRRLVGNLVEKREHIVTAEWAPPRRHLEQESAQRA